MKKTKIIYSSIVIVSLLAVAFYWYQWRPAQIRKGCVKEILELGQGKNLSAYDLSVALDYCLIKRGLEK